jgi:hypothetical protein
VTGATPAYRWCSLYVDTPDQASVVAETGRLLGTPSDLDVFTVPGFTVDVRRNPDRTESAHFLDWRTMVDVDADEHVPDHDVVRFVAGLMTHLRSRGHRVAAECDFSDELPQADVR